MKRWLPLLAAVLVVAGCSASTAPATDLPAPAQAPSSPVSRPEPVAFPGKVAYIQKGELWLLVGGEKAQRLVAGPVSRPVWSPDGQVLAYVTSPTGLGLWQSDSPLQEWQFSQEREGLPTGQVEQLQWSPNSRHLAFVLRREGAAGFPREVWLLSEPGGLKRLNLPNLQQNQPANQLDITWRPDSRALTVALVDAESQVGQIVDLPLDGSEPVVLLAESVRAYAAGAYRLPAWSPDGKQLAFLHAHASGSIAADGVTLGVLATEGHEPAQLDTVLPHADWLAWSPDSRRLAYVQGSGREAGTGKQVVLWNGERKTLVEGASVLDPVWMEDGTGLWTTHQPGPDAPRRIWRVGLSGEPIAPCPADEGDPTRHDYRPMPTTDGGLLFLSVSEQQPSLFYSEDCKELVRVAERFDLPTLFYGHYGWDEVIAWHP